MSCKKPDVARRSRRMKIETDKEIVASYEARRRIKLRIKEVRVKMGIKENCNEKKEGTRGRRKKKGCANVKRCKNLCEEKDKKRRTHVTV